MIKLIRHIPLTINVNNLARIVLLMEKDVFKLINVQHILIDKDVLLIRIINYVQSNPVVM